MAPPFHPWTGGLQSAYTRIVRRLHAMNTCAIRDEHHCYTRCAHGLYAISKQTIRDKRGDCSRLRQLSLRSRPLNFKLSSTWVQLEFNLNSKNALLSPNRAIALETPVYRHFSIRILFVSDSYLFVSVRKEYEWIRTNTNGIRIIYESFQPLIHT